MRYRNNEEFIERCIEIHNDKYDYSKTIYKKWNEKITIICSEHGEFKKNPTKHVSGEGCSLCSKIRRIEKRKLGKDKFIKKSNNIHGNKYDYRNVEYVNNRTKVFIICPKHGEFEQSPDNHLSGNGCPQCSNNIKKTKEDIILSFKKIHDDYTYEFPVDFNIKSKIKIKCNIHGDFEQRIENHLSGQRCPECSKLDKSEKRRSTTEYFITKSNEIHGNEYDYSLVNYGKNNIDKVDILCCKHGEFNQTPRGHLSGYGCPKCSSSKGEKKVRKYLEINNFNYTEQHSFENCKYTSPLKFDFYLPELNTIIEYDGIQHFKPIDYFGGYDGFKETKKRDYIKNEYCEKNGINLIRIGYENFENIESFLQNNLKFLYINIQAD